MASPFYSRAAWISNRWTMFQLLLVDHIKFLTGLHKNSAIVCQFQYVNRFIFETMPIEIKYKENLSKDNCWKQDRNQTWLHNNLYS